MSKSSIRQSKAGGELLAGLLRLASASRPDVDTALIRSAYEVAAYWHNGQRRKSGDPYITHPVAVAMILAEAGADEQTLSAALLHDVVEDTPYTLAALKGRFGAEIATLVNGATALDALPAEHLAAASPTRPQQSP
jgi:GTP pyrophosphokinase